MVQRCAHFTPNGFYAPEYWYLASLALRDAGDDAAAEAALRSGARWMRDVALPNVPAEFRASFLERNPVNRAVLLDLQHLSAQ